MRSKPMNCYDQLNKLLNYANANKDLSEVVDTLR